MQSPLLKGHFFCRHRKFHMNWTSFKRSPVFWDHFSSSQSWPLNTGLTLLLFVGLLGSGKSQLALRYGCIFRKHHLAGLCWRITCQSTLTFLNSLKRLADALGIGKHNTKQNEDISNDESLISLRHKPCLPQLHPFPSISVRISYLPQCHFLPTRTLSSSAWSISFY